MHKSEENNMTLDEQIAAVDNLLNQIKTSSHKNIDGQVLGTAVELIYKCGLNQNEISKAKLKHVGCNHANEPINITLPGKSPIKIADEVKESFRGYLDYLRSQTRYQTDPESPLFPGYENETQVRRHLEKFSLSITAQEIHKIGIKRHYWLLRESGLSKEASYRATAAQFRMTERSAQQAVDNKIQSAGRPKPAEIEGYLKLIDVIVVLKSKTEGETLRKQFSELINQNSMSSAKRRRVTKEDLEATKALFSERLQEKMASLPQNPPQPKEPEPIRLLKDVLKDWNPKG
jgi:hypothetical protein